VALEICLMEMGPENFKISRISFENENFTYWEKKLPRITRNTRKYRDDPTHNSQLSPKDFFVLYLYRQLSLPGDLLARLMSSGMPWCE
jgi:hypothetical protein